MNVVNYMKYVVVFIHCSVSKMELQLYHLNFNMCVNYISENSH